MSEKGRAGRSDLFDRCDVVTPPPTKGRLRTRSTGRQAASPSISVGKKSMNEITSREDRGATAMNPAQDPSHPQVSRRTAIQAGAVGLLGLGMNHVQALRAATPADAPRGGSAQACIYIFLSGGLAQHESFDLKPDAPVGMRGEFRPAATKRSYRHGIQISEHLPGLAQRSQHWAIVRSLTHPTNAHTVGHLYMLTGRSAPPPGYREERETRPTHWPSPSSTPLPSATRCRRATTTCRRQLSCPNGSSTGPAARFPAPTAA